MRTTRKFIVFHKKRRKIQKEDTEGTTFPVICTYLKKVKIKSVLLLFTKWTYVSILTWSVCHFLHKVISRNYEYADWGDGADDGGRKGT